MAWWDFYKLWNYSFEQDPNSRKNKRTGLSGAGVPSSDSIPNVSQDGSYWGSTSTGSIRLRDTDDFIDLSSVTNRMSRYKEYERLRNLSEIESAMQVIADETCIASDTKIATLFHGYRTVGWLHKNYNGEPFLVYCWNFQKQDYDLDWVTNIQITDKNATVLRIILDNGDYLDCTPNHKILTRDQTWVEAGNLKNGMELMPFYRIEPSRIHNQLKTNQFPRIYSFKAGWRTQDKMIDILRNEYDPSEKEQKLCKVLKLINDGVDIKDIIKSTGMISSEIKTLLQTSGFTYEECEWLKTKKDRRKVLSVIQKPVKQEVYDLTVKNNHNFCTDNLVLHNCQLGENKQMFVIETKNKKVKEDLETLFYSRHFLNTRRNTPSLVKNLAIMGDWFGELIIDPENPKGGVLRMDSRPCDSMYRIETTKARLIEFQQSKEGPDLTSLTRNEVTKATEKELQQTNAIRFEPHQIVHFRVGDDRKTFYPYGQSLIEAARGPAHQLRLMEDSMVVYRLCLLCNARIKTNFGWKYIAGIKVGDRTFSHTREGKIVPSKVTYVVNNGKQPLMTLRTKSIEIIGTKTHPVLVNRNGVVGMVDLQDIKLGVDKLLNVIDNNSNEIKVPRFNFSKKANVKSDWKRLSVANSYEWQERMDKIENHDDYQIASSMYWHKMPAPVEEFERIGKLLECEYFKTEKSVMHAQYTADDCDLPDVVDEDFARLLGFVIYRGRIRQTGKYGFRRVSFTGMWSKQNHLNEKYFEMMKKYFKFTGSYYSDFKKANVYYGSSSLATYTFMRMGVKAGKRKSQIPNWVYGAKNNIKIAFMKGMLEANGIEIDENTFLTPEWSANMSLSHRRIVDAVKELWHSMGYSSGFLFKKKNKFGIEVRGEKLKKYEVVEKLFESGEGNVFDFEVDREDHNFVVNGTITANTRAPERRVFYIDMGGLPPARAEATLERLKDQFRKKKTANTSGGGSGPAGIVEERWHAPAMDEDFWVPIRQQSNTRIETLPGACLSLDTEIALLDGRNLSLREIIEEFNQGKQNWTYSCDPKTGKVAPGKISWAGLTRANTQVVKVTFDNDKSLICTPDHHFPVQNKGKTQAQNLEVGDSMFPFERRLENLNGDRTRSKYEQVYDSSIRKWTFTHRMVKECVKDTIYDESMLYNEEHKDKNKGVIHHKNIDRSNNAPENLAWMNWYDHREWHRDHQHITNENISKALKKFHENMSDEDKVIRDEKLADRSINGNEKLQESLKDENFNKEFSTKQKEGWEKSKQENPELHKIRGQKITDKNNEYWSHEENKKKVFDKQRIVMPDTLWNEFIAFIQQNKTVEQYLDVINNDQEALRLLAEANEHVQRDNVDLRKGLRAENIKKIVQARGFNSVAQARLGVIPTDEPQNQNITFPNNLWNLFLKGIQEGLSAEESLARVNANETILCEFAEVNAGLFGVKFRFNGKLTMFYIKQMVRDKGYADCRHLKKMSKNYNHKVVSVEFLSETMDTGTLTIDQDHEIHNYHTFALSCCSIMTYNSNLGEIDDALYFRNKLYTALNFPRNYFNNEDPNITRMSLSSQDARFSRMIERVQGHVVDGYIQVAETHLALKGYPPETYEDLNIYMTPASDSRELAKMELLNAKLGFCRSLKDGLMMADYHIWTKHWGYTEEEAEEIISMNKIQQIENARLEVMVKNPQLLGVGSPGQGENEMGVDSQGPNPALAPDGEEPSLTDTPEGGEESPPTMDKGSKNTTPLADPNDDDIEKYDLEIQSYEKEIDREEQDLSQE